MSHAMGTLPSPKASEKLVQSEGVFGNTSCARGGPKTWNDTLKIQTYCDASFAPGGGRSRSGILILLVDEAVNRASLILWQS